MKVLVTGAAGFIGRMVMAELATRARLTVDGAEREVEAILALDLDAAAMADLEAADPRVRALGGGLTDAGAAAAIEAASPGLVIHLAAVVSGAAEADFDLGVSVNLLGTLELLNLCRRFAAPPVLLFSSSVAVFSCPDNDSIDDDRMPAPRSSYGAQKLMGEILVRDASRKGFVLGRALRFPTISVRPGKPNKAVGWPVYKRIFQGGIPQTLIGGLIAMTRALSQMMGGGQLPPRLLQCKPKGGAPSNTFPGSGASALRRSVV